MRAGSYLCLLASTTLIFALGPQEPKIRPENVTTYISPISGQLNSTAFTEWINVQVNSGTKSLALREGAYHVLAGTDPSHIYLANLHDVTIWMDSVNLTMTKVGLPAFNIYQCSDLITYGPTVWWDTPGFSQATITNVQSTGDKSYDIQYHLDDGYDPSFLVNASTGQINAEYTDPKRRRLQAGPGWSTFTGPVTVVQGQKNTFTFPVSDSYFPPQIGHKLLARGQFIFCNQVTNSNNTIIHDFALLNCAGFGFFSSSNRKTTFNSFSLKPASFPPPNGTELPARSSSADGIHSSGDYIGPTFDSCYFAALDDDCMAVHGSLYHVSSAGSTPNTFTAPSDTAAAPGDILRFYVDATYEPHRTAIVTSVDSQSSLLSITVDALPQEIARAGSTASFANQMRVGSGFAVRNTHTAGNRGRGAIIKASDGVIADNVFEGVSYGALDLGPEFSDWGEVDYVHDISITNNTIRDCNYMSKAGAAFMLHGDGGNAVGGNYNVTIDGLVIEGATASNIYIGAAEAVRIKDVRVGNAYRAKYTLWETWPGAVATFENVRFEGPKGTICVDGGIERKGINMMNVLGTVGGVVPEVGQC